MASKKGCWHWLSWNHPWRIQRYSGAPSVSHHPVRKESKFTNHIHSHLQQQREAGGQRLTLKYSCKTPIWPYQEQISLGYLQIQPIISLESTLPITWTARTLNKCVLANYVAILLRNKQEKSLEEIKYLVSLIKQNIATKRDCRQIKTTIIWMLATVIATDWRN